ncbi:MAG TPA: endo-1,3-alpha-glucanase family glycosylhydrolase [Acidothermaceae bacterium]
MSRIRILRSTRVPRILATASIVAALAVSALVLAGRALIPTTVVRASASTLAPVAAPLSTPSVSAPSSSESGAVAASASTPIPVYAYFYQWFSAASWNRAKVDYPLAGRYSSDDPNVLATQINQAKGAGIDGFLTSWKNTATLDRRLDLLINTAKGQNFDLGVVYEALDFSRNPVPVATVQQDMVYLVDRWGSALTSRYYGRPVIIWTGTDQYSVADVSAVKAALGNRAYLLAASRSVAGYERVAGIVDGEAYYWSSADPKSASATVKLAALSAAVHAHHGLWFAPAASGYDGRDLGGSRVVGRSDGQTLTQSLDNAYGSSPDAIAVISWNEWSENTYIEPGEQYGDRELAVLKDDLLSRGHGIPAGIGVDSSGGSSSSTWTGARAVVALGSLTIAAVIGFAVVARRRARRRRGRGHRPRGRATRLPRDPDTGGGSGGVADAESRAHSELLSKGGR